jgi:hypothetical protein
MRLMFGLLALLLLPALPADAQVGALQTDCGLGGEQGDGTYQFVATCAGRSRSPDGRFTIVQRSYRDRQPPIELRDARGRTLARLRSLSDDMPFSVSWAPNSRWLFVNHHVGSFMDTLQLFEIVGRAAVERPALVRSAVRIATRRYPCLPPAMVLPNGVRWARDSRRIVLFTISAPYACTLFHRPGSWHSLWMIGDVRSGRVDARSIRVQLDNERSQSPRGGVYSRL